MAGLYSCAVEDPATTTASAGPAAGQDLTKPPFRNTITEPNERPLVSATDSEIKLLGHAIVQLYFKGLKIEQRLGVVEELTPNFLLGVDFLTANVAAVDYTVRPPVLRLFDDFIQIPLFNRCDETNCVILECTAVIPAYNEAYLPVKSPVQYNNQDVLLEQPSRILPVTVARSFTSCKNNKTICRVLNQNPFVVTLKRGKILARITTMDTEIAAVVECKQPTVAVDMSVASVTPSRTDLDTFHKAYGFQLCSDLDEEQKYQVLELLYRYKAVFARDLSEIKECKGEPLQLTLHTDRKMLSVNFV